MATIVTLLVKSYKCHHQDYMIFFLAIHQNLSFGRERVGQYRNNNCLLISRCSRCVSFIYLIQTCVASIYPPAPTSSALAPLATIYDTPLTVPHCSPPRASYTHLSLCPLKFLTRSFSLPQYP